MTKTVVILGGGVGGQVVANELRRRLSPEHRVRLIDRGRQHAFAPSFLWVMTGDREPQHVTRDVRELVRPGVEVIQAEIRSVAGCDTGPAFRRAHVLQPMPLPYVTRALAV